MLPHTLCSAFTHLTLRKLKISKSLSQYRTQNSLKTRLESAGPNSNSSCFYQLLQDVEQGTFHSICTFSLKDYPEDAVLPSAAKLPEYFSVSPVSGTHLHWGSWVTPGQPLEVPDILQRSGTQTPRQKMESKPLTNQYNQPMTQIGRCSYNPI